MRPDLNLLTALRVLLEERNVTHAAKRLHVSQPAMSKTLQKLREELNDPLFTRSSHGLIPTPRAKMLESELPTLLDQLNDLVHPSEFTPSAHQGHFSVAGTGTMLDLLAPQLSLQILDESPGTSLHVSEVELEFMDQLSSGQLDFAIHLNRAMPDDFIKTKVGYINVVCAMRAGHPLAEQRAISIEDYITYPHVRLYLAQITRSNVGVVDEILSQTGHKRHTVLETPLLTSAMAMVKQSDCLMVCPDTAKELATPDFTSLPMPAEVNYQPLEMVVIQHRRSLNSRPHIWLKKILCDYMSKVLQAPSLVG